MKQPLYKAIARALEAHASVLNGSVGLTKQWSERWWLDRLFRFDKLLPSGSGFDAGSVIVKAESTRDRIVIATSFHHMDENGFYAGWTEHRVVVKADMVSNFTVKVDGRDRNDIKSFIADVFYEALAAEIEITEADEASDPARA